VVQHFRWKIKWSVLQAANLGAVLEDFVRWYSPRDWIETEDVDEFGNPGGELSPRMKLPGNLWLEVWSSANPVPARRQRRLFDDTKEAEKVFALLTQYLWNLSILHFSMNWSKFCPV
jgi:hypothetical protein